MTWFNETYDRVAEWVDDKPLRMVLTTIGLGTAAVAIISLVVLLVAILHIGFILAGIFFFLIITLVIGGLVQMILNMIREHM